MLPNQPPIPVPLVFSAVGASVVLGFNRKAKRSFLSILELVNISRQIPCYSAGASFLVPGLLM